MILIALFAVVLFVAYSNGANDNFKGVATLFGSDTATYGASIAFATITTLAGSLSSALLAGTLAKAFSGHGMVPDAIAASPHFLLAVAVGAGVTILTATVLGLPVSTTHGLTGGLIGAGAAAVGHIPNLAVLGGGFLAPLIISPIAAVALTVPLAAGLRRFGAALGVDKTSCVCVGEGASASAGGGALVALRALPMVIVGTEPSCENAYGGGTFLGLSVERLGTIGHWLSAGAVSFARGLNDTPKIVGLILIVQAIDLQGGTLAIAVAMALGGLLNARKVAHTMSRKIARMEEGHAFIANAITAFLVIVASRLGLPVSTTHVSVGAISGVGIVNGSASRTVLSGILLAWLFTLPMAAVIGGGAYLTLRTVGF